MLTVKEKYLADINKRLENYILKQIGTKYRLKYHLMPPIGFMNDPNGLCILNGIYHIYYQYSPLEVLGGQKFWGHYSTTDFISFKNEAIAVFPDSQYDIDGVYSGSAFVENGQIDFFYTGNVIQTGDFDYIYKGREQNTVHISSADGYKMSDKKLIMTNSAYPENMSCHVRDPKVWQENDTYYMILGARNSADKGEVLIYNSRDKFNWSYFKSISTAEEFGFMWECPDLFNIDGHTVLSFCPQGVKANGIEYNNEHQSGYMIINGDWKGDDFELGCFIEYDRGFDFYAPQSFIDEKGRRIMLGWVGLPSAEYSNQPIIDDGWQHCLTIPRQLFFENNRMVQRPLEELENMRTDKQFIIADKKTIIRYNDNVFEMIIRFSGVADEFCIEFREDMIIKYKNKIFSVELRQSGYGRKKRSFIIDTFDEIRIFSDTSVIEIFVGGECLTTKLFENQTTSTIKFRDLNQQCNVIIYKLSGFTYE